MESDGRPSVKGAFIYYEAMGSLEVADFEVTCNQNFRLGNALLSCEELTSACSMEFKSVFLGIVEDEFNKYEHMSL